MSKLTIIIITAISTFIVTALWQMIAQKKANRNIKLVIMGLVNDMDEMATKLDCKNIWEYYGKTKGSDYCLRAKINLDNTIKFLK